jgi:UDP-GlcNAc:undecaprenyl-phosphate/decaprenyl-phosphate GlcNAc-1-phosphate transferase
MLEYVLTLLAAAAVTYLLTPLVRRFAVAVGAMHAARDRDVHEVPTPLLGGFAMYAGLIVGLLVASRLSALNSAFAQTNMAKGLLLAGGLIVVMGFVDDRWGMGALSKLAGQVAAGVILVWSGAEVTWLPSPNGGTLGLTSDQQIAVTILVVVMTINAVNFIDGLDGLAAGIVGIGAAAFFIYYYTLTHRLGLPDQTGPALASAVLAGMCLGFLPHNFHPARIFMGDTGAMLIGLLLAYAPISSLASLDPGSLTNSSAYAGGTVNRFPAILPLLLPAAILLIPYADLLMAVVRRTRAGMSPFAADRQHLHHRLLAIGHSQRASVLIMYLWASVFAGSVVWLSILRTPLFVLAIVTVAAVLALLLVTMPRLRRWSRALTRASAPSRRAARAAAARAARGVTTTGDPSDVPGVPAATGALADGFLPTPPAYAGTPMSAPEWPPSPAEPQPSTEPPLFSPAPSATPASAPAVSSGWPPASAEPDTTSGPAVSGHWQAVSGEPGTSPMSAVPSGWPESPAGPETSPVPAVPSGWPQSPAGPAPTEPSASAGPLPASASSAPPVPSWPPPPEAPRLPPSSPPPGAPLRQPSAPLAPSVRPDRDPSRPPGAASAAPRTSPPPAFGSAPASAAHPAMPAASADTTGPASRSAGGNVHGRGEEGERPGGQRTDAGSSRLPGWGNGSVSGSRPAAGPQAAVSSPWLAGLGEEPTADALPRSGAGGVRGSSGFSAPRGQAPTGAQPRRGPRGAARSPWLEGLGEEPTADALRPGGAGRAAGSSKSGQGNDTSADALPRRKPRGATRSSRLSGLGDGPVTASRPGAGPQSPAGSPWFSGLGDGTAADEGPGTGTQPVAGSWLSELGDGPADEDPETVGDPGAGSWFPGSGPSAWYDTAAEDDPLTAPLPPSRPRRDSRRGFGPPDREPPRARPFAGS